MWLIDWLMCSEIPENLSAGVVLSVFIAKFAV